MYYRNKSVSIKEIIREKKEWVRQFDDHPYDFWKRKWDYLCRRLNNYSDMQALNADQKWYNRKKGESNDSQNSR